METAVKERLVGAAVLVLLVVLVVPALLSGPPEPAPPEAAEEGATRSVEIDIVQPKSLEDEIDEPVAESAAVPPVASVVPEATPTASAPIAPQDPRADPGPSDKAAGKAPAPAATPAAPAWAVQVAALSNKDAAQRMAADLKRRGYAGFVLEYRADGRVLYRVRVGPEAQKERAAALATRLEAEGFKAAVVAHP